MLDGKSRWCPLCKGRWSFAKSRLTLQKWMIILYLWVREYPVTDEAEEAEVSKHTAIDVYQWLGEVCTTALIGTRIVLGGPGKIFEIDESLFCHKPKASSSSAISITCLCHKIATCLYSITPTPTDMGVWDGECISVSQSCGSGSSTRRTDITSNNTGSYCTRNNNS